MSTLLGMINDGNPVTEERLPVRFATGFRQENRTGTSYFNPAIKNREIFDTWVPITTFVVTMVTMCSVGPWII